MQLDISSEAKQIVWETRHSLAGTKELGAIPIDEITLVHQAIDESFLFSYRLLILICSGLAMISALCSVFLIAPAQEAKS